jgi:hypothetical protein
MWDLTLGRLQETFQVGGKGASTARRQANGVWPVRLSEVADIDPIGRRGLGGRELAQEVMDGALAARPGGASDEEVIAGRANLQAEGKRVERAGLTDRALQRGDIGGGRRQPSVVDAAPEVIRRDTESLSERFRHDGFPSWD